VKRLHFSNILEYVFSFEKSFGLRLDFDRVLKIQDWIWIANFDSPLISAVNLG